MDSNQELTKKIEQAEYRVSLAEAELNGIRQSKVYKSARLLSEVKNQIKSDPVGLTKKAARILFKEPKKLAHIVRSGKRRAFVAQSIIDQTNKYQEWILLNEPDETELDGQRQHSDNFSFKPIISIITPVYNPPVDVLEELIESVLDQTYPYFELCLGDDYGKNGAVISLIKKYASIDDRIKFFPFEENRGIAGASNRILKEAKGEYIALLDHDDTLSPNALFENVALINEKPYDFIYSDKDKIDIDGNRFDPLFKPQYSPEMMLNVNYLTHLNVLRASIVRGIDGWSTDTNGAQDWDLFLRVIESSKCIGHIPKVLYHWRVIDSSTATSIEAKPYALAGQRKAVDNYLKSEKIPAFSYHNKTELFLKWSEKVIDQKPLIFIQYSSLPSTLRTIRSMLRVMQKPRIVVLVGNDTVPKQKKTISTSAKAEVLSYSNETIAGVIGEYCENTIKSKEESTVVILKDSLKLSKRNNWYDNLTGWLAIKEVGATSGRIVDRHDLIVDSGGIISQECQYFPIFYKYPKYYQSYIGNAEWVRNLSVISSNYAATKLSLLKEYSSLSRDVNHGSFDDYVLWVGKKKRIVLSPQATALVNEGYDINQSHPLASSKLLVKRLRKYQDKFGNPNMSPSDPLRLFSDEPLLGVDKAPHIPIDSYQRDATILSNTFDISYDEIIANKTIISHNKKPINPKSVAWFVPSFDAIYAGLINIFSFANFLSVDKKLDLTVYILKDKNDASDERNLVIKQFPELKDARFIGIQPDQIKSIDEHDIGIATQWATTYPLAKAMNIKRKCYFIQDNETNFYPKGSISSLVELSYEFGFMAIANTEGLLKLYKDDYGGSGVVMKSVVDLSTYYPRKDKYYQPGKPYKVFFYARPAMPRNAFELGIAGLKKLKQNMGKDVEIITAGAPWDPTAYGVQGMFTNLGKIDYGSVPKLYRSVDAGLMFMFSGHPGVTASELMASGCPVVVNEYDDITWHELYQDGKTCLVTKATASEVARNIRRCLEDKALRTNIIEGGLKKTKDFYVGYEKSQDDTYNSIISGDFNFEEK